MVTSKKSVMAGIHRQQLAATSKPTLHNNMKIQVTRVTRPQAQAMYVPKQTNTKGFALVKTKKLEHMLSICNAFVTYTTHSSEQVHVIKSPACPSSTFILQAGPPLLQKSNFPNKQSSFVLILRTVCQNWQRTSGESDEGLKGRSCRGDDKALTQMRASRVT
jgi:hypothetical protein